MMWSVWETKQSEQKAVDITSEGFISAKPDLRVINTSISIVKKEPEILPLIGKNRRLRDHTALWSHENTGREPWYQRNIIFLALLHSSRYSGWLGAKENGEDTNNGRERDKNSLLSPLFDMNRRWGHVPLVYWSPVPLACTSRGGLRSVV